MNYPFNILNHQLSFTVTKWKEWLVHSSKCFLQFESCVIFNEWFKCSICMIVIVWECKHEWLLVWMLECELVCVIVRLPDWESVCDCVYMWLIVSVWLVEWLWACDCVHVCDSERVCVCFCDCEHLIMTVCLWMCMYVNVWLWTSDCESIYVIVCMKMIMSVWLWEWLWACDFECECLIVIILSIYVCDCACMWMLMWVWASHCESLYVWLWTCDLRLHNNPKCQGSRCLEISSKCAYVLPHICDASYLWWYVMIAVSALTQIR